MLVVVVLLATVLLRVAIVTAVVYLLLPQGALCPHCNVEMVAVRNRVLDRLVPVLQRRWCLECGWNGVVRRVRSAHARTPKRPQAPRPHPPLAAFPWGRPGTSIARHLSPVVDAHHEGILSGEHTEILELAVVP